MTTQEQDRQVTAIHPATEVGLVSLAVADLQRSLAFYTTGLGFSVLEQRNGAATLGAGGAPLLLLTEQRGARPWTGQATGLYHLAILLPSRADLGRWLRHWLEQGNALPGQGDHLVSEALYLSDPDGNGIEVYRDRPRDTWTWASGRVRMASDPVDIRGLIADADAQGAPWTGLPAGTRLGHVHLQVGDIPTAAAFYHDVLGFDVVASMPRALFVSAGGYHHHIGLNTWHSQGASAAPAGTVGLRLFTISLPTEEARAAVVARVRAAGLSTSLIGGSVAIQDPWRNTILLQVGSRADVESAVAHTAALVM